MPETIPKINHSISNLGVGRRRALLDGIDATREYLQAIGATEGLAWTPLVRSRLYAEMRRKAANGQLVNVVGGVGLIAAMDQSFAPTLPEAWQRHYDRPLPQRVRRFGRDVLMQRAIMPPVMKSLEPMARIAEALHNPDLFATLYAEELPPGQTYNDHNAPYARAIQLTPDVVEKLGTNIYDLPHMLALRGISRISFSPYNAERRSQSGRTQLGPWQNYLPHFATQGLIRQFTVSLNRTDLPPVTGIEAMARTHVVASELTKDTADYAELGDLAEQLALVAAALPDGWPLDITIRGDVSSYEPERIQNVFNNLDRMARGR